MFDLRLRCQIILWVLALFSASLMAVAAPAVAGDLVEKYPAPAARLSPDALPAIVQPAVEAQSADENAADAALSADAAGGEPALVSLQDGSVASPLELALNEVRRLRAQGGAYAPGLREALIQLGHAYRDAGERVAAADAFAQAFYLTRANHGLYSLEQVPALESLIEENRALGRGDAVLDNYQLLYWVNKRHFGDNHPRLLPYIDRIALTFMNLGHDGLQFESAIDIRPVNDLLGKAINIVETHYGAHDPLLVDVLRRVVQTNYSFAEQTGKLHEYRTLDRGPKNRVIPIDEGTAAAFALISETEIRGKQALRRIQEIYEAATGRDANAGVYARALVLIQQGDWQQLYGSRGGGREYAEAYNLLKSVAHGDSYVAQLLLEPRILPAVVSSSAEQAAPKALKSSGENVNIIEFAFDVSDRGRVHNVELIDVPSGLERAANSLKDNMAFQRFRPRIVDGRAVSTRVVRRMMVDEKGRYLLLDRVFDVVNVSLLPQSRSAVSLGAN